MDNKDKSTSKVEKSRRARKRTFITALAIILLLSSLRSCNKDMGHDHDHDIDRPGIELENTENNEHIHTEDDDHTHTEDETVDNTEDNKGLEDQDPEHQHNWSNWEFHSDKEEIRSCECGEIEKRVHEYSDWLNNDNNTESRTCNNCGYVQTRVVEHKHNFGEWESVSDTHESRECSCGEKEYRKHKFTNWVSTENGKETRSCETCNYTQTRDVAHKHNFGEWKSLNEDLEQRTCSCGEVETRKHAFGKDIITFNTNNNGTHQVITSKTCNQCNIVIENEETKTCKMSKWTYNPTTGLEESSCKDCGYVITRQHTHSDVPKDIVYGNPTSNDNGTHDLFASYKCTVCKKDITLKKTNSCSYGNWVSNGNGTESRSCKECGYTQTRNVAHTHNWSNWSYFNDVSEQRTCSCGEVQTREHSYGNATISYQSNNDGTHQKISTQHCATCGFDLVNSVSKNCSMGSWTYNPTTKLEEKVCSDCGYKETRVHTHDAAPSNLVYGNATSNDNGTHTLHASYNCSVCGEKITLTKNESCNMGNWTYNPTTKLEEKVCSDCGYKITREHIHDAAPGNLVYGNPTSNSNGTHDLHASYTCSVCNEKINLSKTVNCNYSEWVDHGTYHSHQCNDCGYTQQNAHYPNSAGTSITQGGSHEHHIESYVCAECGLTISREVACTSDKTVNYELVNGVVLEYSNCTSCGGKCNQRSHSHNFNSWSYLDDTYEVRTCGCGYGEEKRVHSYGPLTYDSSRNAFVQTCSGCGYELVQEHTHHYGTPSKVESSDPGVCYYEVSHCECGDELKAPVGHDTYERTAFGRTYIFCHNCDLQIEKTNTLSVDESVYEEEKDQEYIEDKPKTLTLIP